MPVVNLAEKFALISEAWTPRIVAELNGQQVKLARFEGEFEWHRHDTEDELFLVVDGSLELHYRDAVEKLGPGEFTVVGRGVEHKPVARPAAEVLLFEPAGTVNTGERRSGRTVESPDWI